MPDIRVVSNKENNREKDGFWRQRFRITVEEENTFQKRRAIILSVRRMVGGVVGVVIFLSLTTYFLVAHTPLTPWLVPGFVAKSFHEDAEDAKSQTDSALATLAIHERYLNSIKIILEGGVPEFDGVSSLDSMLLVEEVLPNAGEGDLELRNKVEREDRFALKKSGPLSTGEIGFNFPPLNGVISDGFDLSSGHIGVDILGAEGSLIHAVDDGTVLISTYTAENGYVIVLQHSNNRVSVYKHNSTLLKEVGDVVRKGDPVAAVGTSGYQSTGPHLHFEWWVKGRPIDPSPWLRK
tara:strand:- start:34 stop:915 length:882 start_codon:yes stop_codon:yes gene_type:complete